MDSNKPRPILHGTGLADVTFDFGTHSPLTRSERTMVLPQSRGTPSRATEHNRKASHTPVHVHDVKSGNSVDNSIHPKFYMLACIYFRRFS